MTDMPPADWTIMGTWDGRTKEWRITGVLQGAVVTPRGGLRSGVTTAVDRTALLVLVKHLAGELHEMLPFYG